MMMEYPGKALTDTYPSRHLCGKRLGNAAPFSSSIDGLPHTCFEDVVLVPLASWLFYISLAAVAILLLARRNSTSAGSKSRPHKLIFSKMSADSAHATGASLSPKWPKTSTGFSILHFLLILATLLMNILEIVRLALADRGIGLLPFTLASLVIIIILRLLPMPTASQIAVYSVTLVFWLFALIFTAVKLSTLTKLDTIEPRTGTEYLSSDQRLDVGVIIGLYGLSLLVDAWRLVRLVQRRRRSTGTADASSYNGGEHKL